MTNHSQSLAAEYLLSERVDPLLQVGGLRLDDAGFFDRGLAGAAQNPLLPELTDHWKLKDKVEESLDMHVSVCVCARHFWWNNIKVYLFPNS